uniref:Si:ch73-233m11.2 n=1 Tax=Mastacembelus armatus TaxID=205130 RepID=A0A3Q3M8C1_9TELE
MDRGAVLTHILNSKAVSTLLGGEPPASVMLNNKYISPLTSEAQETDGSVEDSLGSVDCAIHTSLAGRKKTVVLVGPEGSGKTTVLEKLIVDWAEGASLQNFSYVFYFCLREMNFLGGALSLETLLQHSNCHIPPESVPGVLQKPDKVLFVFDNLDQYRHSRDPSVHTLCSDPSQAASVSCLITSLLQGSLLRGTSFVVATRPTTCLEFLSGTRIEVLGFLNPQREAYFNGFFTNPTMANTALMHMERTLGFYDFSTSPRFCWTVCSMYKSLMDAGAELPDTLTQLYINILVHLIQALSLTEACNRELVLALGRLASRCSLDHHSSCTKDEMDSFGFQQFRTSVGVFLQGDGLGPDTHFFTFHSQLMQKFIMAVFFFLDKSVSGGVEKMLEKHKGHTKFLDLFLSGLSEPVQHKPLKTLIGELNSEQIVDFKSWLKSSLQAALQGYHKDAYRHSLCLLHQTQNESLVKEMVTPSTKAGICYDTLSLQDCVALNYVITCLGEIERLCLYNVRNLTEENAEVLAPAMSLSHKIILSGSIMNNGVVLHLASALSKGITEELDLNHINLGDEKFTILCTGLRDCKQHTIKLSACNLTSCEALVPVLTSETSQLRVLDLRFNELGDKGLINLCKALWSPHCKLEELQLQHCQLTSVSMEALSEALCSGHSELRKVNLTNNMIGDSGVEALCKSLRHSLCKLQSLIASCPDLMEALMSEHCSLTELDLSLNDLGQEGALLLCQALSRPGCPIEKLRLVRCALTQSVFRELGLVLRSGTQLKSLFVGINTVGDQGVKHLWDAVAHPNCLLEELDVEITQMTDACVEDLCAAIRASKTLKNLEMSNNLLTDASVPALVKVMQESDNMQEMNLKYNDFSEDVFDMLEECNKIRY